MYERVVKRLLDIVIALLALPFVLVVLLPCAILIKREDGGSICYNAPRLGRHMKRFQMFKLRSMKENAPDIRNADGSTFNSKDDPRLTKIGGLLRKTSLDELPQLFNVLNGSMSLVGPRPSPLGNEATYTDEFRKKFRVRPGITGYNQAVLRNSATMEQRIANDVYYAENVSFGLDVKILWLTAKGVLGHKNIYNEGGTNG